MKLFLVALKSIYHRWGNALIVVLITSFGVSLYLSSLLFTQNIENNLYKNAKGIDMLLVAKGSKLQALFSSIYHIDNPTGNINYKEYRKKFNSKTNPYIRLSIPLSIGDNYKGIRIVGTDTAYFQHFKLENAQGLFVDKVNDVVLGYKSAKTLNLKVGDRFLGSHGLAANAEHHDEEYQVTGILKESGLVADNLIFTSLETVWHQHGQDSLDNSEKQITAVLIGMRSKMAMIGLPSLIKKEFGMMFILPGLEINELKSQILNGKDTFTTISIGILLFSLAILFLNFINSFRERIKDIATLRLLGASPKQAFMPIFYETFILISVGFLVGFLLTFGLSTYLLPTNIADNFSLTANASFYTSALVLLLSLWAIGLLSTILPFYRSYKKSLQQTLK